MACLLATYPAMPALPSLPSMDDMAMIRPDWRGQHVLERPPHPPEGVIEVVVDLEVPLFVGHVHDRRRVPLTPPAFNTMMSSLPKCSMVPSTTASTSARRLASPAMKIARSPAPISASAFSPFFLGTPAVHHDLGPFGQIRLGNPRPRPRWVPAVIAATLPSSTPMERLRSRVSPRPFLPPPAASSSEVLCRPCGTAAPMSGVRIGRVHAVHNRHVPARILVAPS